MTFWIGLKSADSKNMPNPRQIRQKKYAHEDDTEIDATQHRGQ